MYQLLRLTSAVLSERVEPDGQGEPQEEVQVGYNEGTCILGVEQGTQASVQCFPHWPCPDQTHHLGSECVSVYISSERSKQEHIMTS